MANPTVIYGGFQAANQNSFFSGLVDRFRRYLEFRAAVNELQSMDDHLLQDIGITRTEIEYHAKGGPR